MTRAMLIVNRRARMGNSNLAPALDRLRSAGIELVELAADPSSNFAKLIECHRSDADAIIVGGGDGTLTHAADSLVAAGLPVGILPLGTANDLARTLALPLDLQAAADVIIAGHQKVIDLGWVNGTHFFNVATVGLGADATLRLNHESKSRWGVLAYLFAAASVAIRAKPFHVSIRTNGETIRTRTVQVTVGNGRFYGGGMAVDEEATIDDGALHLFSLEIERWWQIIPLLPALRRGTMRDAKRIRTLRGNNFEVIPKKQRRRLFTADGEITGQTPATFRIVPKALTVFVPEPSE